MAVKRRADFLSGIRWQENAIGGVRMESFIVKQPTCGHPSRVSRQLCLAVLAFLILLTIRAALFLSLRI